MFSQTANLFAPETTVEFEEVVKYIKDNFTVKDDTFYVWLGFSLDEDLDKTKSRSDSFTNELFKNSNQSLITMKGDWWLSNGPTPIEGKVSVRL